LELEEVEITGVYVSEEKRPLIGGNFGNDYPYTSLCS
jgi:hypothetical protein